MLFLMKNISYFSYYNIMFKKDSDGMERKTNDLLHHHYYWIPAAKNRLFLISSKFIFYYLAVDPYDLWSLWSCGSHLIILNYTAAFLLHAEPRPLTKCCCFSMLSVAWVPRPHYSAMNATPVRPIRIQLNYNSHQGSLLYDVCYIFPSGPT